MNTSTQPSKLEIRRRFFAACEALDNAIHDAVRDSRNGYPAHRWHIPHAQIDSWEADVRRRFASETSPAVACSYYLVAKRYPEKTITLEQGTPLGECVIIVYAYREWISVAFAMASAIDPNVEREHDRLFTLDLAVGDGSAKTIARDLATTLADALRVFGATEETNHP